MSQHSSRPSGRPSIVRVLAFASLVLSSPVRAGAPQGGTANLQFFGITLTDVLLLTLTAAALILTWAITVYQWRLARKQYAVQLHAEYYGFEHYVNVVSAVVQVRLKWLFTPDDGQRSAYRELVAAGWAPGALKTDQAPHDVTYRLYVRQSEQAADDPIVSHYHASASATGLTEHQAVGALLHFWSRLAALLDAKAVDRRLSKELFAPAYEYNRQFFASLRETIEASIVAGDPRPAWLDHTRTLERLFG